MTSQQAERNIRLYFWFQLFKEPLFWGPILITFIMSASKMSLAEIYFCESVCVIGIVLLDGPMGALADLLGRRNTMLIGMFFWLIKLVMFASATCPLMIWSANLLWVIGAVLISGADNAMLADTLKFLGRESDYQKIEGRSNAYRLALVAVTSVLAGYLADVNLRLPVFLGVPFLAIALVAIYRMVEPPIIAERIKSRCEYFRLIQISAAFIYKSPQIKWIIAFSAIILVVSKAWFFTYNPYFELVDLPLHYYGWVFCLMNIVAAISSHEAARLSKLLGEWGSVTAILAMIALPIWLMGTYVALPAISLILLQNVVRGFMNPFMGDLLHRHLDSENRATVASFKSTLVSLFEVIVLAALGLATSRFSLPVCLQALGIATMLCGLPLIFSFRRVIYSSHS